MSSIQQISDPGLPDSIFVWRFQSRDGSASWGGTLVADSASGAPGDTLAGSAGTYLLLSEEERGVDLTPFGLDDGQVFVDWYFDSLNGRFLPTRNGPGLASGTAGLGSERDYAFVAGAWLPFGLGGQVLPGSALPPAAARFVFTFEADSGDRWSGVLHERAISFAPGDIIRTPFGIYRITQETAAEAETTAEQQAALLGRVQLTGSYFDNASGASFSILDADGSVDQGISGLGSETGEAWNGRNFVQFGRGGELQVDAPVELRPLVRGFGVDAGGWSSQERFPRMLADVNGDGRADLVGFAGSGLLVSLANGTGFGASYLAVNGFGFLPQAGGWSSQDRFPRMLGDVNGDGRDDIVGFANSGVVVSLADGFGGFGAAYLALDGFGVLPQAGGWESQDRFPRMLGDVNGDGRDDIVGFGSLGVVVSLANGFGGFGPAYLALGSFGSAPQAGGWENQNLFPRMLADVNGDGRDDIVGFGGLGVLVSLADVNGWFGAPSLAVTGFGFLPQAGNWDSQDRSPRLMADVNGDDRADIVGFGNAGTIVSLANPLGGFNAARLVTPGFGSVSAGWLQQDIFPRAVGDINGDGRADVVGFGGAGVWADAMIGFY